ncbi:disease resistance protein RGA5-like [Triticum dicoccoides]|uniref:disease resistance protein RGA5-like n=1 Tax=Triticum dicoccoides TaxID=85692 RepID=UPI0018910451|nr:disease resistance protein RGA5-like [Triticum dicoccoides]
MEDQSVLERILNGEEDPKDLPLALLQSITNDFSQDRQIGQGGFGVVYKGVLRNGIIVAVKRIEVNQITIDDVSFRREFNSLMNNNHQNVVRFLGFCSNTHHIPRKEAGEISLVNVRERLLCFEYIRNGSLDKHITDELRGLEWEPRYAIMSGICKGLFYLHEEFFFVHMDLKPPNILLDDHKIPKITDFGLSRSDEMSHTTGQRFGTPGYVAPEYKKDGKTSFKCDIYSLGVIITELVTGRKSVPHKNNALSGYCSESRSGMKTHDLASLVGSSDIRWYFIVIDDIWDSEAWGLIQSAFPETERGSRVITTTRNHDVALATCNAESEYVYKIKPLSVEDSITLFFRRTFGPKKGCPDTPRKVEISIDILNRCGGMPLAINSIASLLAGKTDSTWEYVWKSLGAMTEGDDHEKMKQILDLSYIHLPDHLKTCLLYVCMYPEDREIDKHNLLRKWVVEGFVHVSRNSGLDAEDVAEKYFEELISMCMIQPGRIDKYSNEVLSCRVHDIILDLMRSKSSKENFIHVIDGSKDETGEIRRVSVHRNDKEDTRISETINKGSLSHVRSVLLYRSSLVPCFLEFKYVRVLHLEYGVISGNIDLTSISRLFLLRYLKIAGSPPGRPYELKLPNQIGGLQQLEIIDIYGCKLRNYPSDIVSLPWLSHLSSMGSVLPDGIDKLTSLRTLAGIRLYGSSVENVKGLGKLTNLRQLEISSDGPSEGLEEATMDALYSSICKLSANLRTFTFTGGFLYIRDVPAGWITRTTFPWGSQIQELNLGYCRFERCPEWIGQLHGLYKICISVREVADGVSIVAQLPSLAYFCLSIFGMGKEEKEESVVIPGTGSGAFRALKHLRFYCKKVSLTFEAGAMPKLEKLSIQFRHEMAPQFLPVGIQHLPVGTLKLIWLHVIPDFLQVMKGSKLLNDDYSRKRTRKLGPMLKRAFKQQHPDAHIITHVGIYFE